MHQPARLITPEGKKIDLPPDIYLQLKQLLDARARRRSPARFTQAIRTTYGKYAGRSSLTQALSAERAEERAREEAKLKRFHGH